MALATIANKQQRDSKTPLQTLANVADLAGSLSSLGSKGASLFTPKTSTDLMDSWAKMRVQDQPKVYFPYTGP